MNAEHGEDNVQVKAHAYVHMMFGFWSVKKICTLKAKRNFKE